MENRSTINFQELEEVSKSNEATRKSFRKRSPTMLKLQWLAERLRKIDKIKSQLAAGTYRADSREVAKAVLDVCNDEELEQKVNTLLS